VGLRLTALPLVPLRVLVMRGRSRLAGRALAAHWCAQDL